MIRIKTDLEKNARRLARLKLNSYKFFCIEDVALEDSAEVDQQLHEFFEEYFPEPAPWEKVVVIEAEPNKVQQEQRRVFFEVNQ